MLYDFCTWLFKKKLTTIRIELNKEYRLETKPVFIGKPKNTPHKHH